MRRKRLAYSHRLLSESMTWSIPSCSSYRKVPSVAGERAGHQWLYSLQWLNAWVWGASVYVFFFLKNRFHSEIIPLPATPNIPELTLVKEGNTDVGLRDRSCFSVMLTRYVRYIFVSTRTFTLAYDSCSWTPHCEQVQAYFPAEIGRMCHVSLSPGRQDSSAHWPKHFVGTEHCEVNCIVWNVNFSTKYGSLHQG